MGENIMVTIHLTGQVTEDGELVFEAPKNLPPGKAKITIEVPTAEDEQPVPEIDLEEEFRQAWADVKEGRTLPASVLYDDDFWKSLDAE